MVKQGMAERFWVWIIEDGYWYRVPEEHSVNKERIPYYAIHAIWRAVHKLVVVSSVVFDFTTHLKSLVL